MDISKLSPKSGRIIGEDGKIYNRVSLLRGGIPVSDKVVDISKMAAESGRLIGEDGKIYNEVDLLNGLTGKMDDIEGEVTELSKLKNWLGETTTPISVNSTTNPITISGVSVMATAGDVTAYDNGTTKDEFIFSEAGTWQEYDDKLDVYTKDETDELLDTKVDKVHGKGLSTNDFTDAYVNKVNASEILLKDNAPKNLLCITLEDLKAANTTGAWGTTSSYSTNYTVGNATFTVKTNESGIVESLGTGEAMIFESGAEIMYAVKKMLLPEGDYILSAQIDDVTPADAKMCWTIENLGGSVIDSGDVTLESGYNSADITISAGAERYLSVYYTIGDQGVTPIDPHFGALGTVQTMLRYAEVVDGTFEVAYHTQKDIDAALASVQNGLTSKLDKTGGTVAGSIKTTKSTFTDNDEFVPKSYVDTHGITDYTQLTNKPSINNVTLSGNKTLSDLGITSGNAGVTVLYNNPTPTVNPQTAALSQPYTDFDFIYITWKLLSGSYNPMTLVLRPEDIPAYNANDTIPIDFGGNDGYIKFPTATSIELIQQPSGWSYVLVNVIGINLGARKPYSETTLYEATTTSFVTPITLSQTFDDFDLINISYGFGGTIVDTKAFLVSSLNKNGINELRLSNYDTWQVLLVMAYDNTTTVNITGHNMGDNNYIAKVTGVKFGGSVKGRNVTSLFTNSGNTNPASITLPTAYTEFDEIIVAGHEANNTAMLAEKFILSDTLKTNDYISLQSGDTYLNYLVASETGLTFANASNLVISSITGIKYDSDYITIDTEMSATSENPVQNKVIKAYVDDLGLSVVNGQLCQTYNL